MDLIENLWLIVKRKLAKYDNPSSSIHKLWSREQKQNKIKSEIIKNLIGSTQRKLEEIKKQKELRKINKTLI